MLSLWIKNSRLLAVMSVRRVRPSISLPPRCLQAWVLMHVLLGTIFEDEYCDRTRIQLATFPICLAFQSSQLYQGRFGVRDLPEAWD